MRRAWIDLLRRERRPILGPQELGDRNRVNGGGTTNPIGMRPRLRSRSSGIGPTETPPPHPGGPQWRTATERIGSMPAWTKWEPRGLTPGEYLLAEREAEEKSEFL